MKEEKVLKVVPNSVAKSVSQFGKMLRKDASLSGIVCKTGLKPIGRAATLRRVYPVLHVPDLKVSCAEVLSVPQFPT